MPQPDVPPPPRRDKLAEQLAQHLNVSIAPDGGERSDADWAVQLRIAPVDAIAAFLGSVRAAEHEVAMHLGLVRGVLDGTPDGMLVVDLDGRVLLANENFGRMWRIPAELAASGDDSQLLGFVLAQLRDPEAFLRRVRDLYNAPDAVTDAEDIAFTDGRVFVRRSCPVYVDGHPAARVWVFHDATALREAERQHQVLEDQLRHSQKMEAVGKLAGGIAHDFNNLLTVINGYARLIEDATALDDPRRAKIGEIRAAGERAATLTRQLLAFGRRQMLAPRVLDLTATVGDLGAMLRRLIGEDIQLQWEPSPQVPRVVADPGQIEQVLMNLVVNARDAMPAGGTLRIALSAVSVRDRDASAPADLAAGEYAMLTVRDSGAGIPIDVQPRIFEPFFTTKEVGHGTGLGLATVYGIVQQSGGRIAFTSAPGAGTEFRLYFPAADAAALAAAGDAGPESRAA